MRLYAGKRNNYQTEVLHMACLGNLFLRMRRKSPGGVKQTDMVIACSFCKKSSKSLKFPKTCRENVRKAFEFSETRR